MAQGQQWYGGGGGKGTVMARGPQWHEDGGGTGMAMAQGQQWHGDSDDTGTTVTWGQQCYRASGGMGTTVATSSCTCHHPSCPHSLIPGVWGPAVVTVPPNCPLPSSGPPPGPLGPLRPHHPTVPQADLPRDLGSHQGGVPVPAEPIPQVRPGGGWTPSVPWWHRWGGGARR